jgi:hypothetical protein
MSNQLTVSANVTIPPIEATSHVTKARWVFYAFA